MIKNYLRINTFFTLLFFIILLLILVIPHNQVMSAAPITGTFITPDLFYTSEGAYRELFQEMKDTGIDTLILNLTSNLSKNCQTGTYTEEIATRINSGSPPFIPIAIKLSKEFNMSVYFSLGDFPIDSACFVFHAGDASNEATDKGRIIGMSMRTIEALKQAVASAGVSWSDPIIKGFYIYAETDTRYLSISNYPQVTFLKEMSAKIKQKEPSKKLLYSPFQSESTDYATSKQAFTNIYSLTSIDILAPQDSMGTQLTTSYTRSSDHFRALKDAVISYPGKEAWANIESFTPGADAYIQYIPTTIDRLKQQITAATPYVNRMITWMYTHTMLSNPKSDNMASTNRYATQYTPENAVRRKALRREYMSAYGINSTIPISNGLCTPMYYYHKTSKTCINTSNTYNSNQQDCNGSFTQCSTNLQTYLPGLTTGLCYPTRSLCTAAHLNVTPTPTRYIHTPTPTQFITNKIPTPTPIPRLLLTGTFQQATPIRSYRYKSADISGDGIVNAADFDMVLANFGKPYSIYDYAQIIEFYGK